MRFRLVPFLFVALLATSSASAQMIDFFARGVDATHEGQTHVHGGAATVTLHPANGLEAGVDVFWSPHMSTEVSISKVHHDLDASAFGQPVDLGGTSVTPISAIVDLHTNPHGRLDLHAGAGASFFIIKDVANTTELQLLGVRSIKFHDKFVPVVNAGAAYRLGPHAAVTLDAKWFNVKSQATATYADGTSEGADLNLRQVSIEAGISFRF